MKYFLLIGLFFGLIIPKANAFLPNAHKTELNKSQQTLKPKKGKNKPKFSWKRVFRPVMIFNRKWSFWILVFGLLVAIGWGIFWLTLDHNGFLSDDLEEGLAYTFVLVNAAFVILILALPIIYIIRLIKEIRIRNRYRKCPKPTRSKLR